MSQSLRIVVAALAGGIAVIPMLMTFVDGAQRFPQRAPIMWVLAAVFLLFVWTLSVIIVSRREEANVTEVMISGIGLPGTLVALVNAAQIGLVLFGD